MLEYFNYKKVKQHRAEKVAKTPVLSETDEQFLERMVSPEPESAVPQQPFPSDVAGDPTGNDAQLITREISTPDALVEEPKEVHGKHQSKNKEKEKKTNRFSFLQRVATKKNKKHAQEDGLTPNSAVNQSEATKEEQDLADVLESLNLQAEKNRAFALSPASQELVQKFTFVLKDLVNGVPTAYDDLTHLLDNSQAQLQKSFNSLPPFIQKLVKSLPTKLTGSLAPEVLAAASEAQGFAAADVGAGAAGGGFSEMAAKAATKLPSLKELVTKPGAIVAMLKSIMNVLKLRWPAFMGANVLWSLALFILLFVFWYCHKRGREVRLEKEKAEADKLASEGRIEDLRDEPTNSAPIPTSTKPVPEPANTQFIPPPVAANPTAATQ
ncbi:MAG: hypothetical protein M1824_004374 [Vezdaea acicularis]|nr:MAG: hypothetical protein M1824_004374 [Vezdaea acicularis]